MLQSGVLIQELLPVKIAAVIFDMDGVVTDSEPLFAEAIDAVLCDYGLTMSQQDHLEIMGSSIDYTWNYLLAKHSLDGSLEQWKARYDIAVSSILGQKATSSDGLYQLLDELERREIPIALATSSQLNWVKAVLNRLDLENRFLAIATADMVNQAKPAPDLYLLAAMKLNIPPGLCLAIEDSPRGLSAAKAAGMKTVAVHTKSTANLDVSEADYTIDSLEHFDYAWLED